MKIKDFLRNTKLDRSSFEVFNIDGNLEVREDDNSLIVYPDNMGNKAIQKSKFYNELVKSIESPKTKRIKINIKVWSEK